MSTQVKFLTELNARLDAECLTPTKVWEVSGYTGHQFERGRVYVSTAKTEGPRWITTAVAVPGREPKKPNGKIRSMFKSDDLEAIKLMIEGLSSTAQEPERRSPAKKSSAAPSVQELHMLSGLEA